MSTDDRRDPIDNRIPDLILGATRHGRSLQTPGKSQQMAAIMSAAELDGTHSVIFDPRGDAGEFLAAQSAEAPRGGPETPAHSVGRHPTGRGWR